LEIPLSKVSYTERDKWLNWMKLYLEVRPGCFLDIFEPLLQSIHEWTVELDEDLRSLGIKDEDLNAIMKRFMAKKMVWKLENVRNVEL
jgi:hypothetical protein